MRPLLVRSVAAATGVTALALPGLFGVLAAAPVSAGAATTAAPTAQSLYEAAIKAASDQSVHFTSLATQNGITIHVSGDTGATSGAQTLTVTNGRLTEHVSAIVVGSTGYVNANSTALHYVIGLSSSKANKYANKWLSFPTSNSGLDQLVSGLLNSQVVSELEMSGPYTYGTATTIGKQHADALRGSVKTQSGSNEPVILYVSATGSPTPIEEVTNPGASAHSSEIHGTVNFSNWGEKTSEKAPAHSVSLLKIASPTSGTTSTTAG